MCDSIKRVKFVIVVVSLWLFVGYQPVDALSEKEEVFDDFDSGTSSYLKIGEQEAEATAWYLSKYGDLPPYGIVGRRPPMEPNGGGFIEVVPLSDTVATVTSVDFKLFPGATMELVYWKMIDSRIGSRTAVLLIIVQNIKEQTETTVFRAPNPTSSDSDWITTTVDLGITESADVRVSDSLFLFILIR